MGRSSEWRRSALEAVTLPIKMPRAGLGFELGELGYKSRHQFARYSSCKPVLRQVLEMVAGARYVPNRQFLSIPFRSELIHEAA